MFDVRLRDKLLFEDSHFTYSRRYFWAYNTLGVINEGIKSMRSAYLSTFTKDFWAGRHPTLWPYPHHTDSSSADGDLGEGEARRRDYLARMDVLRQELESAVAELQAMHDKNETARTEVRSLREQLFSGSSVKESRRAIEQGDNIKILTNVSMIFLPLTFVVVSRPPLTTPFSLSPFPTPPSPSTTPLFHNSRILTMNGPGCLRHNNPHNPRHRLALPGNPHLRLHSLSLSRHGPPDARRHGAGAQMRSACQAVSTPRLRSWS
jgi:hypothetical protein